MVPTNMDALEWLRKHLDAEGSDSLREMVRSVAERLMAAEVDAVCNARPDAASSGWASRCRTELTPSMSTGIASRHSS
jgi:hypothetical protein